MLWKTAWNNTVCLLQCQKASQKRHVFNVRGKTTWFGSKEWVLTKGWWGKTDCSGLRPDIENLRTEWCFNFFMVESLRRLISDIILRIYDIFGDKLRSALSGDLGDTGAISMIGWRRGRILEASMLVWKEQLRRYPLCLLTVDSTMVRTMLSEGLSS